MSASATPIPPHRFAEAIAELPLANLHSKSAEIRNSISHLESSNVQLQLFADEGDRDCAEAIQENGEVMLRMEERIALLKNEVERRGFIWGKDEGKASKAKGEGDVQSNGRQDIGGSLEAEKMSAHGRVENGSPIREADGRLESEERAEGWASRTERDVEDDGLHL
ncbi:MAG: hypothetical protein Q9217_003960 [Psora testacea]